MASAKFLEEALSTDVDESAVNAIVGSLEDQLVTSGPNRNSSSGILNPAPACSDDGNTNEFAVSNEDSQNSINSANSVTSLHSSDSVKIVQSSYVPSPSAPSLQNSPMNTSHNNTPTAYINPMQQKANEVKMIYPTTTQALVNQQMINSRVTYPQSLPSGSIGLAPLSQAVLHTTTPVNKTIGIQQNLVIKQAGGGIPAGLVSMPMSVTSSIPGVVTLSKPAGQTTQTISGQPTLLANVPILNMRPPNNPHKTVATVSPRVVLGAPTQMMQSRPSTPGITLQTLPGLPPGQQGHLLLKTENGQYQLLRVGPAPAQNALGTPPPQALRLSTVPAVSRPNNQFSAPPLLRKCIPSQQSGVATVSTTGPGQVSVPIQGSVQGQLQQQSQQQSQQQMQQQSQQQMQQQSQQQTQQQTQHQGIVQNAPSNLTPVQASGLAPVSVASVAQKTSDNTKEKCRNFLANLLDLSSREPVTVERNVRTLIQELIDNKVEPEQFCDRLERLLKASPQPCLIGFLKKSLPLLRQSLIAKELVIEGIQAPPPQALYGNPPTSHMVSSHMNIVSQNTMPVTSMNIQQNRTMTVMAPGRMQAHTNPSSPVTLQPPALVQAVQSQAMNVHPNQSQQASPPTYNPQYPVQYTQVSVSDINFNPDELLQAQVRPMGRGPSPSGGKGPTGSVIVPSMQGPTKVINRSQPKPNLHNAGGSTKSSFPKSAAAMSSPSSTVSSKSGQREKDKKQTAATFAQAYADIDKMAADDDINDVAAMGGVNLAEESQRILGSTEMIGTQIRSCKDEYFLNMTALQARIKSYCVKRGLEEPSIEVSGLISHAVQERLKTVMSKLAVIAEHRIDLTKPEPGYEVTKDLKSQLKFLEELDRVEKKRREDSEREMLLRAAKSRSKNEDPEQAKLKAKAKELQRVEMEEIRQREANLTALQAIGPRKKPKLDLPNSSSSSDQNSGTTSTNNGGQNQASSNSGPNNVPVRSRLKRVNVRDLIFLLESEKDLKNTSLLYRAYLK